jgi:hypothetical protein
LPGACLHDAPWAWFNLRMRQLGWLLGGAVVALCACGSSEKSNDGSSSFGASGSGGGGVMLSGGATGTLGGASGTTTGGGVSVGRGGSNSGAGAGNIDACAETAQSGKQIPLDIFIMMDVSGSMLETTGAALSPTKWDAVKRALQSFVSDSKSDGIGVGIQYFPLRQPGVPDSCTADAQCGSAGPCFLKFCKNAGPSIYGCGSDSECTLADGTDVGPCTPLTYCYGSDVTVGLCHDSSECDGQARLCVPFLACSADDTYSCTRSGAKCVDDAGRNLGTCGPYQLESYCLNDTACGANTYAAPAVDIATLPGAASAVIASINAQMLASRSLTPTAPALHGALDKATAWAKAHSDHTVVVLLATDGLPTECIGDPGRDPSGIDEVSLEATSAVAASPSISTFVIGVFGPDDTDASMNLNRIAKAGGTKTAFMIDTSGDVTTQFLDALNAIRSSELACEYQLPAPPPGQDLDLARINVDFTMGTTKERLVAVSDAASCDPTSGGWYYDANPVAGGTPTKIVICPKTCDRFTNIKDGSVEVAIGCQTKVR